MEPSRPEHWGQMAMNPITNQVEKFFDPKKRRIEYFYSFVVVIIASVSTVALQLGLVLLRHHGKTMWMPDLSKIDAASRHGVAMHAVTKGMLFFQFLTAIIVEIFNWILGKMAERRTIAENHRTQTEHDNWRLAKSLLLKMVNSYATLYYMGFFKRRSRLFGEPVNCIKDDCFLELQAQLGAFVIVHLVVQNLLEYLVPRLRIMYVEFHTQDTPCFKLFSLNRREAAKLSGAEKQAKMEKTSEFEEFDETLISHGFLVLFCVAAPWLCAIVMFGSLFEIIIDAKGLCENTQRPMPKKVANNEPWSTAFEVYGFVAALTNVGLLVFGSDLYDGRRFTEKLVLFIFLEHLVVFARFTVAFMFPVKPQSVSLMQLKNQYMVHRCLENVKVEQASDYPVGREAAASFHVLEGDMQPPEDGEDVVLEFNLARDWGVFKGGAWRALSEVSKPTWKSSSKD